MHSKAKKKTFEWNIHFSRMSVFRVHLNQISSEKIFLMVCFTCCLCKYYTYIVYHSTWGNKRFPDVQLCISSTDKIFEFNLFYLQWFCYWENVIIFPFQFFSYLFIGWRVYGKHSFFLLSLFFKYLFSIIYV